MIDMPMLPAKLIVVNDVFEFPHGLLVFLPSVPYGLIDEVHLRTSDCLELRRPDGTVLKTTLYALGRPSPSDGTLDISVKPFTKADVPIGTEVWKVG